MIGQPKPKETKTGKKKLGLGLVKTAYEEGKKAKNDFDSKVSVSSADYAAFEVADTMYTLLTGPTETVGNMLHSVMIETDKVRIVKVAGSFIGVLAFLSILISVLTLHAGAVFFPIGCLLAWTFIFMSCTKSRSRYVEDVLSNIEDDVEEDYWDEFDDDELL